MFAKFLILFPIYFILASCSSSSQKDDDSRNVEIYATDDLNLSKEKGRWEEIIKICKKEGLESGLRFAGVHYGLQKWNAAYWSMVGDCYSFHQQLTKAKIYYTKALTLNKNSSSALVGLSLITAKFDNGYDALNLLLLATKNNPDSNSIKKALGIFYLAWGLNGSSLKQLQKISNEVKKEDKDIIQRSMAMNYAILGNDLMALKIFSEIPSEITNLNYNSKFLAALSDKKKRGEDYSRPSDDIQLPSNSPLNSLLQSNYPQGDGP
ncbi:MAG: hypothetical protein QE271_14470 [Bacteriovoracaceae bacterium]|nr:hypothetical protein [Bacteriovoracaceae bacterium]